MNSVFFLLSICLFIVTVTGSSIKTNGLFVRPMDLDGRITNGSFAANNQFPYQVALIASSNVGRWFCGGSIISKNYILTAAHCTDQAKSISISMGSVDRTKPKLQFEVEGKHIKQHKNYSGQWLWNDISLIEVPDITFSDSIQPVALPSRAQKSQNFNGQIVIASGWGRISDSISGVVDKLKYLALQITTNNVCAAFYTTLSVRPFTICADTVDRGSTCSGDSGGPLVEADTGILVGVTSFVSSNGCESGSPAGFSRVTYFLDWIAEQTGMRV